MQVNRGQFQVQWTKERDQQMIELLSEGLSASQVGKQMGVSRNAVIGRADRIGVALNGSTGASAPRTSPRPQRAKPYVAPAPSPQEPESLKLDILSLNSHTCHFPQGPFPFYYCGHTVKDGGPYCSFHHAISRQIMHAPRRSDAA